MSLKELYKTDPTLEKDGVWLDFGETEGDDPQPIRIKISRAGGGNRAFQKFTERAMAPHKRALQRDELANSIIDRITKQAYATTIVKEFLNVDVEDEEGNSSIVAYTPANALLLFDQLPAIFEEIVRASIQNRIWLETVREEDQKN
jgi:hypothetical protein